MSSFDAPYKSLLQGVSQQIPKLRLDGQVNVQDNMLSDIVTNIRRRPGAAYAFSRTLPPGETHESVRAWDTDIAGQRVHVIVGTVTGILWVFNQDFTLFLAQFSDSYMQTPVGQTSRIRATTVGNNFYLLNTGIKPITVAGTPPLSPAKQGFFYIKTGAFSKEYTVAVTTNFGTVNVSFTTPTGTGPGDAANSTPDHIAQELTTFANLTALTGIGVTPFRTGAYVYLTTTGTSLTVASGSGSSYLTTSGSSRVRLESDLPAILPVQADNYIVAVGEQKLFRYYQYKSATTEWLECGVFGSPVGLANMPISLEFNSGVWSLNQSNYEGRVAGDEDTNPLPEFLTRGLSGMGAFQSRLVLLGGSKVYMSSSVVTRRFMRSTVTGILDADPIAAGASANSSAEYQYAVPFQKDLLLFSQKYQALVPSSGQAITPRTATVLLTSQYSVDTLSEPVPVGRTMLFPAPRSKDFFGFMEMVSSQYTDAQYVANDATAHLPKYMGGKCRFGVSSSVASMVLFGPSADPKSLVVYEYQWDGDTKVQQAWHTWHFEYPIATAYFSNESVNILFVQNSMLVIATLDPRQGILSLAGDKRPYLDNNIAALVTDNKVVIPDFLVALDPDMGTKAKLTVATGPQAGELVGTTGYDSGTRTLTTVRSFPSGLVYIGVPYRSTFSPSPPVYRDQNGLKVESEKFTVLRFGVNTQNSSEYQITVSDSRSEDPEAFTQATLYYSSRELDPGEDRSADQSRAIIPARTVADTTDLEMYTEDVGELNFTGIDYTGRLLQRRRRR